MQSMLRKLLPASLLPPIPVEPELESVAIKRTSTYTTSFGNVIVTWSRTNFVEPSVHAKVQFAEPGSAAPSTSSLPVGTSQNTAFKFFDFEVSLARPDMVRGLRRFVIFKPGVREPFCIAKFAWDFSRARCPVTGSAQPSSGYYFAIVLDDEMLLTLGDMQEWAYGLAEARQGPYDSILTSREDRVSMNGTVYTTSVRFGGVEREISIILTRGQLTMMSVRIDKKKVVFLKSALKAFRGTFKYHLPDGDLIQVTWDLHDWVFGRASVEGMPVGEGKEDGLLTFSFIEQEESNTRKTCPGNYLDMMRRDRSLTWRRLVEEWVSSEEERMSKGETFFLRVYLYKS